MLWEITRWVCFVLVFLFVLSCVFDLFRLVDRLFQRATGGSVDESIQILYADEKCDPTVPPVIEYAATKNARQFLRRGR
jgi:Na+-transporting methylmalonyl-CoA/oxaloacetate decarboxylase gamma subunit